MPAGKENAELMGRALELAEASAEKGTGPFGCVITKDGKIISEAANAVTEKNDPTAHAEIEAIRRASIALSTFNLSSCYLYTSSYPCAMCLGAIYWANIEKVYYGASVEEVDSFGFKDGYIKKEVCLPLNKKEIFIEKINISGTEKPFNIWQLNNKKIKY